MLMQDILRLCNSSVVELAPSAAAQLRTACCHNSRYSTITAIVAAQAAEKALTCNTSAAVLGLSNNVHGEMLYRHCKAKVYYTLT